jgi:8-amino-7-oxononanoate synthase
VKPSLQQATEQLAHLKAAGAYPYFPVTRSLRGNEVVLDDGRAVRMFASCDYLGLAQDARVKRGAIEAIAEFGTNTHGGQMFCGYTHRHRALEERLAAFFDKEAALLFPSGMHANLSIIATLMGPGDAVINDRYNHSSIFMGCQLSGARTRSFPHSDLDRLEAILKETQDATTRLIVLEGVYSQEGDFAPLPEICALADRYGARLMMDEAHSVGVCGPGGRGVAAMYGLLDRVDFMMGTMSKALGSVGGFVAASRQVVDYLRHVSNAYLGSRGSPPPVVGAAAAALAVLDEDGDERRGRLRHNVEYALAAFRDRGIDIMRTASHIVPVFVGSEEVTMAAAAWLTREGVLASAMVPPGVPPSSGRLRFGITSWHTAEDIDTAADLVGRAVEYFGLRPMTV